MIRTLSSVTTEYYTHAIVTDDNPGYVVTSYNAIQPIARGADLHVAYTGGEKYSTTSYDTIDEARAEIERRADADHRARREKWSSQGWHIANTTTEAVR